MASGAVPASCKVAILRQFGEPLKIEDRKIDEMQYGDCAVRINKSGVCHTDLHVQMGDWEIKPEIPIIPGHEGVGEVIAIAAGVTEVKIGDRVCLPWLRKACGSCTHCVEGWETVCEKVVNGGFSAHGAFAHVVIAPAKFVGRVPDGLSDEQAAPITCAGVTVYKGLKQSQVRAGQYMVIVGAAGGLGHLAVQYAHAMGMKVVAIDSGAAKVTYLRKLQCEHVIDVSTTANVVEKVRSLTNGGSHGALILVPRPQAIDEAIRYSRPRACIVPIALPKEDFSASAVLLIVKNIRIQGSIVGTRQDLIEAMELAQGGRITCNIQLRPFSEVNKCLEEIRAGTVTGRLVLDMTK